MTASLQLTLAAKCPRCGRGIPDDGEILALTEGAIGHLRDRRIAVPDNVYAALGSVVRALRCRLGQCERF